MRTSILTLAGSVVLVAAFAALPCAADPGSQGGSGNVFGFSSEDWGGGSSYLGVDTRDITPDRLSTLHLKEEHGVEVTMVDQDAPAGKAGLKEQDVILTLNGEGVESVEQLRRMIRETPPGRVVNLGVSRNGQPMTIKVQLADRKRAYAYSYGPDNKEFHFTMPAIPPIPNINIPPMDFDIPVSIVVAHSSARSGLMVENITPQLGEFFGTKDGNGVLVRSVEKGSLADKAGLKAGDIITKINGQFIHDASDFTHALRSSRKETTATIGILRDKKEQTVTLKLPERRQGQIFNESLDIPEMQADTAEALADLNSEMADLKPQLQEAINKEMTQLRPEIERQKKELAKQQEKLKKQLCDMQKQWHEHQSEIQRELKEELQWGDSKI